LIYADDGLREEGEWQEGERHGLCRLLSVGGTAREETSFAEGVPEGPARVRASSAATAGASTAGAEEQFAYVNGVRHGPAVLKLATGDIIRYTYVQGVAQGQWVREGADASKETANVVAGVKQGPAVEVSAAGDTEERHYVDGVRQGPALVMGAGGDRLDFTYRNGHRVGPAVYTWKDGAREEFTYDEQGNETGPAKLVWPNKAKREGAKLNGHWHGQIFYTYGQGPRQGRQDVEIWEDGKVIKSRRFYGKKEEEQMDEKQHGWEVQTWEDLDQMADLTKDCAPLGKVL
jgi:hypothetical protein